MSTIEHCRVCGGVCLTSWQIKTRLCAACIERDENWQSDYDTKENA